MSKWSSSWFLVFSLLGKKKVTFTGEFISCFLLSIFKNTINNYSQMQRKKFLHMLIKITSKFWCQWTWREPTHFIPLGTEVFNSCNRRYLGMIRRTSISYSFCRHILGLGFWGLLCFGILLWVRKMWINLFMHNVVKWPNIL